MYAKAIWTTIILVLVSLEAQAIERYTSTSLTCAKVQALIKQDGAAIMRYAGSSGVPLYGKFVRDSRFCTAGEMLLTKRIPASDTKSCRLSYCERTALPAGRD